MPPLHAPQPHERRHLRVLLPLLAAASAPARAAAALARAARLATMTRRKSPWRRHVVDSALAGDLLRRVGPLLLQLRCARRRRRHSRNGGLGWACKRSGKRTSMK